MSDHDILASRQLIADALAAALTAFAAPGFARSDHRSEREDWSKLTTPDRLDKMQARQAERAAAMTSRIDATRSF
jgi:hypothetical protein